MRPTLVALALTASLLASSPGRLTLVDQLWAQLSALWSGPTIEEGCGWDPNGGCRAGLEAVEAGCGWDPSGCPRD